MDNNEDNNYGQAYNGTQTRGTATSSFRTNRSGGTPQEQLGKAQRSMADERNRNASDAGTEEDILGPFWARMRQKAGPRPDPTEDESPTQRAGRLHPGELVLGSGRKGLVRIQPDGTVIYEDGYTPTEAAVDLWTAIGQRRPYFDQRMRYMDMLELHVALIAVADQAYETAQHAAHVEGATETERFREEMSRRNLETRVHGIIEFAREYASMRPDLIEMARRVTGTAAQPAQAPVEQAPDSEMLNIDRGGDR